MTNHHPFEKDVVDLEEDKIWSKEPGLQSCSATAGLGTPSKQFNLWLSVFLPKTWGNNIYLPEWLIGIISWAMCSSTIKHKIAITHHLSPLRVLPTGKLMHTEVR